MKKKTPLFILLGMFLLFTVLIALIAGLQRKGNQNNIVESTITISAGDIKHSSHCKVTSYIGETIYKGKTDIPQLYEFPFRKTDAYVMNKTYASEHPQTVRKLPMFVSDYFKCLLGADYRNIIDDPKSWDDLLSAYYDPSVVYSESLDPDIRDHFTSADYIEQMSENLVTNRMSIDTEFVSDDSLVYSDGYIYVRGLLRFTIRSCDGESPYPIGEEQQIILDVAVKASDYPAEENENPYKIVSFQEVK